jgi:hypothetical protein
MPIKNPKQIFVLMLSDLRRAQKNDRDFPRGTARRIQAHQTGLEARTLSRKSRRDPRSMFQTYR